MNKRDNLTKSVAVLGTVLVWLPLLAPLVFGLVSLAIDGIFRLDYLMPAEFFPVTLVGGGLLAWAAWRAGAYRRLIAGSMAGAVVLLIGSQLLAVVTGLASGDAEPGGWQWLVVMVVFGFFVLAVVAAGVGGVLLVRGLFRRDGAAPRHPRPSPG